MAARPTARFLLGDVLFGFSEGLLAIGVRSGGVWKVGVTGTLKLIRQMELKRTIDKNPGAQDPDTGVS